MRCRPRLFAGIELDARVRAQCAHIAERLKAQGLQARFEAAEKLHITLAFLGWVDAEQVEAIRNALHDIAGTAQRFTLILDTLGAFPHERRPKIVWIGAREQGPLFRALAHAARRAYESMGFSFDKEPVPHVTVARIKGGRAHLPMLEIRPMQLDVSAIALFESLPDGRTTRYELRDRAPLN